MIMALTRRAKAVSNIPELGNSLKRRMLQASVSKAALKSP
jgi:hypothetical protein